MDRRPPKRPPSKPSDAELVSRCLAGDQQAWQALVDRYAALVHSVPARHGLPPMEVEDVAQETFLALARNLDRLQDPQALASWLMITARRLSWRALARNRRESVGAEDDLSASKDGLAIPATVPTMDELLHSWTRQEALHQALAQLDPRCQELLTLLFLDAQEPSYARISQILGIPVGSIGPTRNRCLAKLRRLLQEQVEEPNELL